MNLPPYPKYKSSGAYWLGDIPTHWEVKRGRFVMGINPPAPKLRALKPEDEVSFVPMEAVGLQGGLRLEQTRVLAEVSSGYTEFQDGDVVVAKITPCFENGKAALAHGLLNGAAYGTTELHVLRAGTTIDRNFLFYVAISDTFRNLGESEMSGAGGQKRVPPEFNKDFKTPLPPLVEQQTIAAFLDRETGRIDRLVAKKLELIERLKEKRTALISHAVTRGLNADAALKPSGLDWLGDIPKHWEAVQLRRKAHILDCKHRTVPFIDEGIPLASICEVHGFEVDLTNAKQTSEEEYLTLIEGHRRPRVGDIIYSRNATVGDAALVTTSDCFCMGQDVCLIRAPKFHPKFLLYLFRSPPLMEQVESLMIGSTFRRINVGQIHTFWICAPPLPEQIAIAAYLDAETAKLDALVGKVEEAVERLQEYRTALITAAVTGKIDVRNSSLNGNYSVDVNKGTA